MLRIPSNVRYSDRAEVMASVSLSLSLFAYPCLRLQQIASVCGTGTMLGNKVGRHTFEQSRVSQADGR